MEKDIVWYDFVNDDLFINTMDYDSALMFHYLYRDFIILIEVLE